MPRERREARVPLRPDVCDPTGRVLERRCVELVAVLAAAAVRADEPGGAQRGEVLGDGLAGHR